MTKYVNHVLKKSCGIDFTQGAQQRAEGLVSSRGRSDHRLRLSMTQSAISNHECRVVGCWAYHISRKVHGKMARSTRNGEMQDGVQAPVFAGFAYLLKGCRE